MKVEETFKILLPDAPTNWHGVGPVPVVTCTRKGDDYIYFRFPEVPAGMSGTNVVIDKIRSREYYVL